MTVFEAKRLAEQAIENREMNSSTVLYVICGHDQAVVCSTYDTAVLAGRLHYVFSARKNNAGEIVLTLI